MKNDESGIAVQILFRYRNDSASLHLSPLFLPASSLLSPLAQSRISPASAQLCMYCVTEFMETSFLAAGTRNL
jgi:hypothetical protein